MADFYIGHDNTLVYALTGLIYELTSSLHSEPRYLHEKLDIIIKELSEGTD
jgi:hypothetical protein